MGTKGLSNEKNKPRYGDGSYEKKYYSFWSRHELICAY